MKRRIEVSIVIRSKKAYLPTLYRSEKYRLYFDQEPVLIVDLLFEDLVEAVKKKIEEGNPPIEVPEDLKERERWLKKSKEYITQGSKTEKLACFC